MHGRSLTLEDLVLLLNQVGVEHVSDHIVFLINDFLEFFDLGFERLVFDQLFLQIEFLSLLGILDVNLDLELQRFNFHLFCSER